MGVYGYARVSSVRQADEGESLEVQRRKIEGRAMQDGLTLDTIFVERGVSGSRPMEDRPEGAKLLDTIQHGDVVIASKLDRMFRSANDALRVLDHLKAKKVSLVLLDMGGDVTGDGIAQLVFTILSAVAQFERERLQERVQEVKADQRRRGRYLGGKAPFGYRVGGDGTLEEVPGEQRAIAAMLRLRKRGAALRRIASEVSERYGMKVSHEAVRRVLADHA